MAPGRVVVRDGLKASGSLPISLIKVFISNRYLNPVQSGRVWLPMGDIRLRVLLGKAAVDGCADRRTRRHIVSMKTMRVIFMVQISRVFAAAWDVCFNLVIYARLDAESD